MIVEITRNVLAFNLVLSDCLQVRYFFTCVVTAFLTAGNPCITPKFM